MWSTQEKKKKGKHKKHNLQAFVKWCFCTTKLYFERLHSFFTFPFQTSTCTNMPHDTQSLTSHSRTHCGTQIVGRKCTKSQSTLAQPLMLVFRKPPQLKVAFPSNADMYAGTADRCSKQRTNIKQSLSTWEAFRALSSYAVNKSENRGPERLWLAKRQKTALKRRNSQQS